MNLPKVIAALVKAQDSFDSEAYANCFSENAVVVDEGHTHRGKAEIKDWIAAANNKYRTIMRPLDYQENKATGILTAEVSGSFPGSPLVLKYHLLIEKGLIQSLKITG